MEKTKNTIWLKNPLAILCEEAGGGLVIEHGKIIELVPSGKLPQNEVSQIMENVQNHHSGGAGA